MSAPDRLRRLHRWLAGHPVAVSVACICLVLAALALALWEQRGDFAEALTGAGWPVLASAVGLHLLWLVARTEAWHVCVGAAGGSVERRRLYRASSLGYLGNQLNPNFGLGVRIAALRRSAPAESPGAGVLLAAEAPIIVVEIALVAICSFTLIGPLGVPWWVPIACLALAACVCVATTRLARAGRSGIWRGLAVMRGLESRNRIVALTVFAVSAGVARNWLILRGIGVEISVLDSMALLIGTAVVGLLPVGPTSGPATAVLILGANGVAVTAAAGALLTATSATASMIFAAWALGDRLTESRSPHGLSLPLPRRRRAAAS